MFGAPEGIAQADGKRKNMVRRTLLTISGSTVDDPHKSRIESVRSIEVDADCSAVEAT